VSTTNNRSGHSSSREPAAGWWAAGSLAIACIAALPLFLNTGFLNTRGGGDSPFLLFRLHELTVALQEGIFPVRWMPNAAFGMGYPFFNYYAALPYYFAALFRLFGFSFVFSLKLTQLAGFLVAGIGMYAWIKRITGKTWVALLASAAYTFAPFHMVNIYVRGDSLAEFWSMAWYPLILLAITVASEKPSARRITLVALAYGMLVMTHNVSALIFSPFVAIYAVGCGLWAQSDGEPSSRAPLRAIGLLAAGGILGLILAAWVWLPAIAETGYVQLGDQTTGYLFYGNHFRSTNLIQTAPLFNYDTGSESSTPFAMGLVQAILTGAGVIALTIRMIREKAWWRDGFLLFGLAFSTFMITPLSEPIWAHVPMLPFAQFPWRFLSVQALFSAAVIGALGDLGITPGLRPTPLPHKFRRGVTASHLESGLRLLSGFAIINILLIATMAVAMFGALRPNFIPLNDADVTPQRLQWYESFSGNIGTTIRYEYLPKWTVPRPYTSDILLQREPRAKFLNGEGEAHRESAGAASQTWQVDVTSADAQIAIPVLYFPGWQASVDGEYRLVTPVEGIGYSQIMVPQGGHTVRLWLGHTPIRLWAEIASLLALIGALALWRPRVPRWDWVGWGLALGVIVTLISLSMLLHALPPDQDLPGPLNADFSQEAYFHHSPGGIVDQKGNNLGEMLNTRVVPPVPLAEHISPVLNRPGLFFVEFAESERRTLTIAGDLRGSVYLAPPYIYTPDRMDKINQSIAQFGPINLLWADGHGLHPDAQIYMNWSTEAGIDKNYSLALRLFDVAGNEWGALDTQAGGAGAYPTGLWQPNELIHEGYQLPLESGAPPGTYSLQITLYDLATLQPIGSETLNNFQVLSTNQISCDSGVYQLTPEVGLSSLKADQTAAQGNTLNVEVAWNISAQPEEGYQAIWTLNNSDGEAFQAVTDLAPGSDPHKWEPEAGQCGYVIGKQRIDLPRDLVPGDYALYLQLADSSGKPVGNSYEAGKVTITPTDKLFDVPPLDHTLDTTFGDSLKWWGYSINQSAKALDLSVAWGASRKPDADYKYFVHLLDPKTNQIVAQADAMPRNYTYPTTRWIEGEVVPETITLDLTNVLPGSYQIAVGWYDPNTGTRLNPSGDGAEITLDGRVILPEKVTIP